MPPTSHNTMAPKHQSASIPWNDLSQHISLGRVQPEDTLRFFQRTPAESGNRKNAILRIATAIAHSIERRLEEKSALFSKPDASQSELRSAGVVLDGDLFPPEVVQHAKTMRTPPRSPINKIDGWNFTFVNSAHIAVVLHAMSTPDDPFTHLPLLFHLAQRPRTPFLAIQLANFRLTDPPGCIRPRSVIDEYIMLTCRQYIFLNVLLALDESRNCFNNDGARKMETFPHMSSETFSVEGYLPDGLSSSTQSHSEPHKVDVSEKWFPQSGDKLHNSFWRVIHEDDARRECIPSSREAYIQRCFDVIAVWYAVSKEASKTCDTVRWQNSLYSFNITDLFAMVLDAFRNLGDAFHMSGEPLDELLWEYHHKTAREEALDDVVSVPATPYPSPTPSPIRGLLELPAELQYQIISYLPVHDLISLSMVCRSIHHQCITSMLRDPLSILGELSTGSFDAKVYRRFQSMLESRPHLLHHVRRYTGYYNHLQSLDVSKGSSLHYNESCLARGVDIRSPLASQLSHLNWAELDLWNMEHWKQDADRGINHVLQVAQKCWPDLQNLELKIHQEADRLSSIPDRALRELAGKCSTGCSCEPPSWHLRQLSITAHGYGDMFGIQHASYPPIPLLSLLEGCSGTLRCLKLDVPSATFGDVHNTPNLFNLSHLVLPSNLPPQDVEVFLSRCPNLSSLELGAWDFAHTVPPAPLDLSTCPKLETIHLRNTPYTISRLPVSLRCIKAEILRLLPLKLEVYNPLNASVSALGIKLDLDARSRNVEALQEFLAPIAKEYPKLSFLELKIQGFYHGTDDQLVGSLPLMPLP
ncbi:hypothetical protein L218DRAFT_260316 [Marasmius fiardii PR-910]|nr:hypothetical protein L218DRAFT_260316 [Marasmius fiardii PR-910]